MDQALPSPPPDPPADPKLQDLDRNLLECLTDLAEQGEPCPITSLVARRLRAGRMSVQLALARLKLLGLIDWRLVRRGQAASVRVVTILASGKRTSLPLPPIACPERPPELEAAITRLRRLGHIVFDAAVTDGLRGVGLIRVDHRRLTPERVLALAGEKT